MEWVRALGGLISATCSLFRSKVFGTQWPAERLSDIAC